MSGKKYSSGGEYKAQPSKEQLERERREKKKLEILRGAVGKQCFERGCGRELEYLLNYIPGKPKELLLGEDMEIRAHHFTWMATESEKNRQALFLLVKDSAYVDDQGVKCFVPMLDKGFMIKMLVSALNHELALREEFQPDLDLETWHDKALKYIGGMSNG